MLERPERLPLAGFAEPIVGNPAHALRLWGQFAHDRTVAAQLRVSRPGRPYALVRPALALDLVAEAQSGPAGKSWGVRGEVQTTDPPP